MHHLLALFIILSILSSAARAAQTVTIGDPTYTNYVSIKAASTAAAAGDTSIVVGLSPNSPTPAGTNTIGITNQGTQGTSTSPWYVNLRTAGGTEEGTSTQPVIVSTVDGQKATYSASVIDLVVAATPTDIVTITGSASKTVRITRIAIGGTLTTGAVRDVSLIKRSAANSGGTSATMTAVPHDSNSAGATATVLSYTANPTSLGAEVGDIRDYKIEFPATNLSSASNPFEVTFGDASSQAVVLRGTSQVLAVNLEGNTANGSSFNISIQWTEE